MSEEYEQEDRPTHYPIVNATWQPQSRHGWHCNRCQVYMKLLPINKDIPATHWQCQCRGIALIQRDAVFEKNRQIIQDAYELKTFSYDIEKNYWKIQSAEWISSDESRVNAKRKIIHTIRREGIKDELKHMIEDELNITVESFQDYFIE